MSLENFGAKAWASLRPLERDEETGEVVCPGSGQPISHSRGEIAVPVARLADDELRAVLEDAGVETLRSRGYESHKHAILVPETVSGPSATGYSTRMVGVLVQLGEAGIGWVPVHIDDLEAADRALELSRDASAAADGSGSARASQATDDDSEPSRTVSVDESPERPAVVDELNLPTEHEDGHPRWTYVGHTQHDSADVYAGRGGDNGEKDLLTAEIGEDGWLGNPYPLGEFGSREEVVALFTDQLLTLLENEPEYRQTLVEQVRGKVLGCWYHRLEEIGHEDAPLCHADVLARAVDRVIIRRDEAAAPGGEQA
ncbi:DUF4326 domain-containing protein [Halobacteria archaeon HArc-gm2]|nr:DUF4326 domain-containing protein [Halobacteria archaeon HArc-gm2]